MPNQNINHLVINGETRLDLRSDTVDAAHLAQGYTAHDASGAAITGTMAAGDGTSAGTVYQDGEGYLVLDEGAPSGITVSALSVTANGTYTAPSGTAYSPVTVSVSGGGTASKAVDFHDYDGTVLHSYTKAEFAALTEMPANPTHSGFVAQGWNWSLSDAQAYMETHDHLSIGQMFVTASGRTEIDVVLEDGYLSPYLMLCPNGTVTVDWGDGSPTDTMTGTSYTTNKYQLHEYAQEGAYTISVTVESGGFSFYNGGSSANAGVLRMYPDNQRYRIYTYSNDVRAIRVGSGVDRLGYGAFSWCQQLRYVTIPSGVTSIGNSAFSSCYALTSIDIPSGVTSIGSSTFQYCYDVEEYHLRPTTPPTLAATNAFQNIPSDCVIYVPQGCLSDYESATNWSTYASYMQEEP